MPGHLAVASSLCLNLILCIALTQSGFGTSRCARNPTELAGATVPAPSSGAAAPSASEPVIACPPLATSPPSRPVSSAQHAQSPLFFSRSPVQLQSVGTQIESIYGLPALSHSRINVTCAQDCHQACTVTIPTCVFWSLDRRHRVCYVFTREAELLKTRSMRRGVIERWISGTPSRPFALFASRWTTRPPSQRTLVVVNFNWRATLDDVVQWSWMYPRVPEDVDFVLVQPYAHALSLSNPWSDEGKMGYVSMLVAHDNLPGYRDYQFINDDAPYFFRNVHFNVNITAQSWTNAHWDQHANNVLFKNVSFPQGRNWWMWCAISSSSRRRLN